MRGLTASLLVLVSLLGQQAAASPVETVEVVEGLQETNMPYLEGRAISVTVNAPAGSIIGKQGILTATETFNGIPFAVPPVGNLRLRKPERLTTPLNNFNAVPAAPACPQMVADSDAPDLLASVLTTVSKTPLFQKALNIQEDCLNLNIIRPKGVKAGDNLPVLFWIYGGGFELGWNSMYDASGLVNNAVIKGKPYVFVAVNYRVAGWGFMPGKEILADGSANLGILDQRMGLEWVADNIAAFGGDPNKVTIWGESAGSISVWSQMSLYEGNHTYKGKPLFRGAIMNSGSITPTAPVDGVKGQAVYDAVVAKAGCQSAANTLDCLRALPLDKFTAAANSVPAILSYNSVALSYLPRPDGTALAKAPEVLLKEGKYAPVPFIIGDQEDEGTLFALFQKDMGSTDKIVNYLKELYFIDATKEQIKEYVDTYPNLIEGSPFRTSIFNEIYPGFKRLAALLGDMAFTLARRVHLNVHTTVRPEIPAWSYISSYAYGTPIMGTFHASDILQVFFGILPNYASNGVQSYYANFVYNLDPNDASGGTGSGTKVRDVWRPWTQSNKVCKNFYALWFQDLADDFRSASYAVLEKYAGNAFKL